MKEPEIYFNTFGCFMQETDSGGTVQDAAKCQERADSWCIWMQQVNTNHHQRDGEAIAWENRSTLSCLLFIEGHIAF
jgi:hypothetical protein